MPGVALQIRVFKITGVSHDPLEIPGYRERLAGPVRIPFDETPFERLEFRPDIEQFLIRVAGSTLYIQTSEQENNVGIYIKRFGPTTRNRMTLLALGFILDLQIKDFVLFVDADVYDLVNSVLYSDFSSHIEQHKQELDIIFEIFSKRKGNAICLSKCTRDLVQTNHKRADPSHDLYYEDSDSQDIVYEWFSMRQSARNTVEMQLACLNRDARDELLERLRSQFPNVCFESMG